MRLHLLGLPQAPANKNYNIYAFTQKIINFCKMFKAQGMYIIYYGTELCEVECDEFVPITSKKLLDLEFKKKYGKNNWREHGLENASDELTDIFNKKASLEISLRKKPKDFLITFYGIPHKQIFDNHSDLIGVEVSIGYPSSFAPYKVYESYAVRHGLEGVSKIAEAKINFYDTVIPSGFDLNEFEFSLDKEDYFLMCGRIVWAKGLDIALQVTEKLNKKLILAGTTHGVNHTFPNHVEFIGPVSIEQRKKLMSKAKATFCPTYYNEPFGYVAIESMLSGTPVITVDYGAYTETVLHGITGYRCSTFEQFCWAAENIEKISPYDCRYWAEKNYSLEKVGTMYKDYFESLEKLFTEKGWYSENPDRNSLDYLTKYYP